MAKDDLPRLRHAPVEPPLRVVLVEPEIPQNTGNIARLCAATQTALHLVGPLGFRTDEKAVRRAGVDYWHLVDLHEHKSLEAFTAQETEAPPRWHLFSAVGTRSYLEADVRPGDALVFGRESVGLPSSLLKAHAPRVYSIPTAGAVRSLNLANAVAIVIYESLRRLGALADTALDAQPTGRR